MTGSYLERLAARSSATGTVLCLGLDPDPGALPRGFTPDLRGIASFARLIADHAAPYAAAVKPNLAFYEAFGSPGLAALERLLAALPPGVPVVADAKRGDIGSTAKRQATALFDVLGADAVTVNPYVGVEGLAPFLERSERFVYLLCRTSNPGSEAIQRLMVAGGAGGVPSEPLYARIARLASGWRTVSADEAPGSVSGAVAPIGLVVGATAPAELAEIRLIAPELPFLVPGVGAQGGEIAPVLLHGPAGAGPAAVRAGWWPAGERLAGDRPSRARRAGADQSPGPGERLAEAARAWALRLPVL